jgi:hypothetical protein
MPRTWLSTAVVRCPRFRPFISWTDLASRCRHRERPGIASGNYRPRDACEVLDAALAAWAGVVEDGG